MTATLPSLSIVGRIILGFGVVLVFVAATSSLSIRNASSTFSQAFARDVANGVNTSLARSTAAIRTH